MRLQSYFDYFPQLTEAQNGGMKSRELILQLAVRGKLVAQDPVDDGASAQLQEVIAERTRLFHLRKTKKIREIEDRLPDPYEIALPVSWRVEWLGNVAQTITKGATPTTYGHAFQPDGIRFVKVENVKNGRIIVESINDCISKEAHESQRRSQLELGDVLFSIAGTIGETCVVTEADLPANTNQALAIIRGTRLAFVPQFLKLQMDSYVANAVKARARGGAMNNVSLGDLKQLLVYIPPFTEQHRIVTKVNELMRLCDDLEEHQQAKRESRIRLNNAVLAPLNKATSLTPEEFKQASTRLADNFDTLYDSIDTVAKLRSTILQLAVQGKLVRQDPNDETAAILLSTNRRRTADLTRGGKLSTLSAQDVEPFFEVPKCWQWTQLGELGVFFGGGTPSKSNPAYWQGTIPWISPKDMKKLYIVDAQDHISEAAVEETTVRKIPVDSLLMVVRGMILAHSFPVALTRAEITINQDMKALVFWLPEIAEYVLLACRGLKDFMLSKVARSSHGTCRLEFSEIESFAIPIPPLAEQIRILAKLNLLMSLCDDLEAKLFQAEADREALMNAAVQHVLSVACTTNQARDVSNLASA